LSNQVLNIIGIIGKAGYRQADTFSGNNWVDLNLSRDREMATDSFKGKHSSFQTALIPQFRRK
jgi:hypothetical protein